MSSTNRGTSPKESNRHDYYVTPIDEIVKFLHEFIKIEPSFLKGEILDPCAGGDSSHPMSYPEALKQFGIGDIQTVDIRNDSRAEIKMDYLTYTPPISPNLIITNPPFFLAQKIIEKALREVAPGGFVVILLRLNYFGSDSRLHFWRSHMPVYAFVHHRRMSFTNDGKTDSIEYMHAVWKKGDFPEFTKIKVI